MALFNNNNNNNHNNNHNNMLNNFNLNFNISFHNCDRFMLLKIFINNDNDNLKNIYRACLLAINPANFERYVSSIARISVKSSGLGITVSTGGGRSRKKLMKK
jgi:hypothetical protein